LPTRLPTAELEKPVPKKVSPICQVPFVLPLTFSRLVIAEIHLLCPHPTIPMAYPVAVAIKMEKRASSITKLSPEVLDTVFSFLDVALNDQKSRYHRRCAPHETPDTPFSNHYSRNLDISLQLSSYVTVCKLWGIMLERRTFSFLTLSVDRCNEAGKYITPARAALVRSIDMKIDYVLYPEYPSTLGTVFALLKSLDAHLHKISLRICKVRDCVPQQQPCAVIKRLAQQLPSISSVEQLVLGKLAGSYAAWHMFSGEDTMHIVRALPSVKTLVQFIHSYEYLIRQGFDVIHCEFTIFAAAWN
jgi:hypothetical protein